MSAFGTKQTSQRPSIDVRFEGKADIGIFLGDGPFPDPQYDIGPAGSHRSCPIGLLW